MKPAKISIRQMFHKDTSHGKVKTLDGGEMVNQLLKIPMLFLFACISPPSLSTPHLNRGAHIQLEETSDAPDFSKYGTYRFTRTSKKEAVHATCKMHYQLYQTEKPNSVLVILSHGFTRSGRNMQRWAEHLASWGFSVVTPNHCHLNPTDVNPPLAAQELITLSNKLDYQRVIYAGQSNGGAISIMAAAQDPKAIAVVGLDTTESYTNPTGAYAQSITIPVYGLLGEPSGCNAQGNGKKLYEQAEQAYTYQIQTADHCDFENPSGLLCYMFCSLSHDLFSRKELRANIVSLMTAAMLAESEQNKWALKWWEPATKKQSQSTETIK